MFNGIPNDQFHHFIASRTSLPIPLSPFPLHSFPAGFDPYRSSCTDEQLQHLHHQSQPLNIEEKQHIVVDDETEKSMDHWSSNEVFLLLKVRSSMENWFPDFSWEHVSRKLGELGFKRSAVQCKEKFEEESRNVSYNKNYRVFTELDEFYPGGNQEETRVLSKRNDNDQEIEKQNKEDREEMNVDENSENVTIPCEEMSEEVVKKQVKSNKKRKRKEKFEMLKGFCVEIVNKMMAQQEELHNKLIEDIAKRDEEIIAREEAWKNEEMGRSKMEIEKWAQEQAIASERQTIIIEFLKKFTCEKDQEFANQIENLGPNSSALLNAPTENTLQSNTTPPAFRSIFEPIRKLQEGTDDTLITTPSTFRSIFEPIRKLQEGTDDTLITISPLTLQNQETPTKTPSSDPTPSSIVATKDSSKANSSSNPSSAYDDKKGDIGMRWPRDQVLALINLRCKFGNATSSNNDEATIKAPLWEKISQGMMELGYNRSSKRCKEKWENINKYYRKTKDSNKKRSVESRTCPYFHELSRLYREGTIIAPTNE